MHVPAAALRLRTGGAGRGSDAARGRMRCRTKGKRVTRALAAMSVLCALALAGSLRADDLPAGKGRETLQKVCTACHGVDVIQPLRNTRAQWQDVVDAMKGNGAEATPAEFAEIVNYLALNLGPGKASAASVTSAKTVTSTAPPRALPWEKNHLKIGQALFRENCVVCHDVDQADSKKFGPSFYHLFQRDKMPKSSQKPNRPYIAARIKSGGQLMPSFAKKLNDADIDTLIDYLASK
jgi:mono/diheme cytochrome c family protein